MGNRFKRETNPICVEGSRKNRFEGILPNGLYHSVNPSP